MRAVAVIQLAATLIAASSAQTNGPAAVRCRIVDDIHGTPIPNARLTLTGRSLIDPIVAESDTRGSCTLPGIPSGNYSLSVRKAGFFPVQSGVPNGAPSIAFVAHAPGDADLGTITLVSMRRISGMVRWQDEEPAAGVTVHALRVKGGKAALRSGEVPLTRTNDHGEFTIDRVPPGRYVVYAFIQGVAPGDHTRPEIALPVFYPGTPAPDTRSAIDLLNTPEITGLVLHLQEAAGVIVSGQVIPSISAPKGSTVHLGLFVPGSPAPPFAGTIAAAGDEFRIRDVPPGSYLLLSVVDNIRGQSLQPVEVGTAPVEGIRVTLQHPVSISGRAVVVQSGGVAPTTLPAANVALHARPERLPFLPLNSGMTNASGEFTLDGAYPGETYILSIDPPPGTYIQRVVQNTRDLSESPFPISAGEEPVEVILGNDGGRVTGALNLNNGDRTRAFVVLAPDDRKRKDRFRVATTDAEGSFHISDIPPGDYHAFALVRNDEDAYLTEGYLDRLGGEPVKVTIRPGDAQTLHLKIVSPGRDR